MRSSSIASAVVGQGSGGGSFRPGGRWGSAALPALNSPRRRSCCKPSSVPPSSAASAANRRGEAHIQGPPIEGVDREHAERTPVEQERLGRAELKARRPQFGGRPQIVARRIAPG